MWLANFLWGITQLFGLAAIFVFVAGIKAANGAPQEAAAAAMACAIAIVPYVMARAVTEQITIQKAIAEEKKKTKDSV